MKATMAWLVPDYIREVRDDFKKNYNNLRRYPKMTEQDWSLSSPHSKKEEDNE